ncbi:hypothetical protein BJX99DRAFT_264344 [Aspergillus californicus]
MKRPFCACEGPESTHDWHPWRLLTCLGCKLVTYCSERCRKSDFGAHRLSCINVLTSPHWEPNWWTVKRNHRVHSDGNLLGFVHKRYLWGNVPALDVLKLSENEGREYGEDLSLMFAASGDLRHVFKTIALLPSSYTKTLNVTVNDHDFFVVGRNIVLLLIAFASRDMAEERKKVAKKRKRKPKMSKEIKNAQEEVVDCMIHYWYSAFLRQSDIDLLQHKIRPLIQEVCDNIVHELPEKVIAHRWTFAACSLRVSLAKGSWSQLLSFVDVPPGDFWDLSRFRHLRTLNSLRQDSFDWFMMCLPPSYRISRYTFRAKGLLLPFAYPCAEFKVPNPVFFRTPDFWPIRDDPDPLFGWPSEEVFAMNTAPATSDIYGKICLLVKETLDAFYTRLWHSTANIGDQGWLGIERALTALAPLLRPPSVNPHATLITLFMTAVTEKRTEQDQRDIV